VGLPFSVMSDNLSGSLRQPDLPTIVMLLIVPPAGLMADISLPLHLEPGNIMASEQSLTALLIPPLMPVMLLPEMLPQATSMVDISPQSLMAQVFIMGQEGMLTAPPVLQFMV